MLSHANLLYNAEGVARTIDCGPGDRMLSVLPMHHTFESTIGFICALRCGSSVAYARARLEAAARGHAFVRRDDLRRRAAALREAP